MAVKYEIVWSEDGSSTVSTAAEIHKDYGGAAAQEEFIAALLSSDVLRKALMMETITKLSPEDVYDAAQKKLTTKKQDLDAARLIVDEAVIDILSELTKKQIDEGEVHTLSNAENAAQYGIVEYWLRKSTTNLEGLIKTQKAKLPDHVYEELEALKLKRKRA